MDLTYLSLIGSVTTPKKIDICHLIEIGFFEE